VRDHQRPDLTLDQTRERIRSLALRIRRTGVMTADDLDQLARASVHEAALLGVSEDEIGTSHLEPFASILREQNQAPAWLHA
jgi:hypothetical protein